LQVKPEYLDEGLKVRIERLLASDNLIIQRKISSGQSTIDNRQSTIKDVDIRGYLSSIVLEDKCIVVECRISPAGSIRVEEILGLLELDQEKLAAPIRRTCIQWQQAEAGGRKTLGQKTDDGKRRTEGK